jgi:Mg-chelatase subunit ChlD
MSEEQNNKLANINKVTIGGNKFGLAKRIAEAQNNKVTDYSAYPNRLGLVMDDSGSMSGVMDKCHLAIDTFIKNCNCNDTALALYPLNAEAKNLTNNYAQIGLYSSTIRATGGTPLFAKLKQMIQTENLTRAVAFSDGDPTDSHFETEAIALYIEKKIPIDTIFIGSMGERGYLTMQRIAEKTGGIFLHFTDASVLAKSLKYLTPAFRYMLENADLKAKAEKGVL